MRTISVNLYSFDELSNAAKERALNYFRKDIDNYIDSSDIINTIEKIAAKCDLEGDYYSYDGTHYEVSFYMDNNVYGEEIENLHGKRAFAYVMNNFILPSMKNKIYRIRYTNKTRKSQIFKSIDDCPFTGYIADYCFAEAFEEWKTQINNNVTVFDFIKLLEKKLSNEWNAEIDYAFSDEYIEEMIYCNSYEFLEDGTVY